MMLQIPFVGNRNFSLVERLKATEDLKLEGELQWAEV